MTTDPQTIPEADADTVANRAAQVITSMGADIRALTGERDRYRGAWRSARERAQAYGEGILRVVKDREQYQEWLRQAEERAAAPVAAPPTGQTGLRERIAALFRHPPGVERLGDATPGEIADAVLSVLPADSERHRLALSDALGLGTGAPWDAIRERAAELAGQDVAVDRSVVYRELADRQTQLAVADDLARRRSIATARRSFVKELRRLAAETPGPETQAAHSCGNCEGIDPGSCLTNPDRDPNAPDAPCPTPETHNWGCGCPSDVAAAIASCPGYEMDGPSPCRCPCEGCKHNCGAHQPAAAPAVTLPGKEA